ncbi:MULTISPECIES: hypothetical protein [unclassified Bradyrhizobium]|uniref:hypothetical protein n=1 Tax=unclassified Bradyrhizobium TaxID=2631580 RepID=UPI0028E97549|nr:MULTISPECIES: hypothetical protein [unclassified Bradyrhizobium]
MAMNIHTAPRPICRPEVDRTLALQWGAIVAAFSAAIVMRHIVAASPDVSWLLIAGERWLDGQRLYSEILETNPPMAVFVYLPGILIARALGWNAEDVVDGLVFLAIALSLGLSALILRKSTVIGARQGWVLAITAVLVLAVLPVQSFGQREHIAVIEMIPAMAALALRLNRETPPAWTIGITGVGLGLALCFKPHFAPAMFCCLLVAAASARSWRVLVAPENIVAVGVILAYSVCTIWFFPEYFTFIVPLIRDVYSIGQPMGAMLMKPAVPLLGLTLIATLVQKRCKAMTPTLLLLLAASVCFGIVYLLQRKGWPYHAYPMLAFSWLGFGYAISFSEDGFDAVPRGLRPGELAACGALFLAAMVWFNLGMDARFLQPAIARTGLQHPTILAISADGAIAHPLTRAIGGVWASREQRLLVPRYEQLVRSIPSSDSNTLATLAGYAQRERAWLIEDFRRNRPAIVLVDNATDDWAAWIHDSPELDRLLQGYRLSETVQNIDVYVRRGG